MLHVPKTDVAFLSLIENPLIILILNIRTTIGKGLSLTKLSGQEVLIFTCDQQLYKVTIFIDIILFHNPTYLECVVPILGCMQLFK